MNGGRGEPGDAYVSAKTNPASSRDAANMGRGGALICFAASA